MSLYQLGILWAGDQNPCPALAREGAGREGLPLSFGQAEWFPCSGTTGLLPKQAVDPGQGGKRKPSEGCPFSSRFTHILPVWTNGGGGGGGLYRGHCQVA